MRKVKVAISLIVTIAIMVAIFMFSNQDGNESGSLSAKVALWIAENFISGFSTMDPSTQLQLIDDMAWPIRKTAHATEYGCLAISLVITCWQIHSMKTDITPSDKPLKMRVFIICIVAFVIAVLYACTDELHQLYIDGRAGQVADVFVDASGAIIGSVLSSLVLYFVVKRRKLLS